MVLDARNCGGVVICRAEHVAQTGFLDARRSRVPVSWWMPWSRPLPTSSTRYNSALSGQVRIPVERLKVLPLDTNKVIARGAANELLPNSVLNLGIGLQMPRAGDATGWQLLRVPEKNRSPVRRLMIGALRSLVRWWGEGRAGSSLFGCIATFKQIVTIRCPRPRIWRQKKSSNR